MWSVLTSVVSLASLSAECESSVTTASGTHASRICSGNLIFEDKFDKFRLDVWQHENTLAGGGAIDNNEFQYYNNNRTNTFVKNGMLYIRPSLTSDQFGIPFLTSGTLNVDGGTSSTRCTNSKWNGCERTGNAKTIINPIKSARIRTVNSFSFRYGYLEVRAKMSIGDWLWPAIRLLPTYDAYGSWPTSGELTLAECRGNIIMFSNNVFIGNREGSSAVLFGPWPDSTPCNECFRFPTRDIPSFNSSHFHRYQLDWRPNYIKFGIDDYEVSRLTPTSSGFWSVGRFNKIPNVSNPWRFGTHMAPFDQKFHIVFNLAVGGTGGYFPDGASNPDPKPWSNTQPTLAARDFWNAREKWLKTWKLDVNNGRDASLIVDYVRVWAL